MRFRFNLLVLISLGLNHVAMRPIHRRSTPSTIMETHGKDRSLWARFGLKMSITA